MSVAEAAALILFVAVAAFGSVMSGFGFALILTPPLSFLVTAKDAVVLVNLLGVANSVGIAIGLRRRVVWQRVVPLAVMAFVGMPVGLILLKVVPGRDLRILIAVTVLIATVVLARGRSLPPHGRAGSATFGFISGVLNTSTSINGPPVALYLAGEELEPAAFRATLAAFFAASSLFVVVLYLVAQDVDREALTRIAVSLPGLAIGWSAGTLVVNRISREKFRACVLVMLFASAIVLLTRSILG
jgi:uncharacterized membrane protein YfcA